MSRRLSRLVLTEFESYLHDLVVWGGTVFFVIVLILSFMGTVVARSGDSLLDYLSGLILLSVSLSSVLLAVKVSQRNALEKRTRLFSQLPVSVREVSVATWCVRLLWLSVPTLACTVVLARAGNMPFARFVLVTVATYLGATTLVAAISVAMNIGRMPSPIPAWANRIYVAGAIIAVGTWFIGNRLLLPPSPSAAIVSLSLPGLTGCLMVSGVGLVVLDVWLRERADDYLG